jgi:phosphatidylglycerol:prolipoprotein diacylglycerol transferase
VINIYGILISFSIFIAVLIGENLAKKAGKATEVYWGGVFWGLICGILGARFYHVLHLLPYYATHPMEIPMIWQGGLGLIGGIIGGLLGFGIYLKRVGSKLSEWLDIAGVVIPLAQAIGRWGNFFNQEIYGPPTSFPWGICISPENRPSHLASYSKFHPLFLYESLLNLILFGILWIIYKNHRQKLENGSIFAFYLVGYSIIRFFLEFLRADPASAWFYSNLNVAQILTGATIILSIYWLIRKNLSNIKL